MTPALYRQILNNGSYREKLKNIIDFNDIIDYLISKDVIREKEYMKIWNNVENRLDVLFDILKTKTNNSLLESFNIFKNVYGNDFEKSLRDIWQEVLDDVHRKGGFPKVNNYIPRIEEEMKIKNKFGNIKWDNSLVVYGRVGEGKSYTVCECLKDEELVWEYFENKLYWVNVGECENNSNILQPLARLLKVLAPKKKLLYELTYLVDELQKLFASDVHKKSLVILDNARSLKVIDMFQRIRCKLIIITHYKTVKYAESVEINSGFTLNETVSLFSKYLATSVDNLSNSFLDDIKDIHEQCKGHPSTLALLAVVLNSKKELALRSKAIWNYIKEKIDRGEIEDLDCNSDIGIQKHFQNALRMCIDTIKTEEMKDLYYHLAVFPKDANISTEVLAVYWGKTLEEVWEIMLHFENRSLINSFYNSKKQVYVYVIHDLFLNYLKAETKYRMKDFHKKLITTYINQFDFHTLPDDNYILLFLGYHLKQADMTEMFEKFMDLRFIDHKIRMVGVNNMEQDLKMYKHDITNGNPKLQKKLDDCLKFIRENKNELRQLEITDIVQLALPTLEDDAQMLMVRNQANSINKLYFKRKFSAGRLKSSQEIFIKEVSAMTFCTDSNVSKILVGLRNGTILLYCSQDNKQFDKFLGHSDLVYNLKVAIDNSSFLSVSNDKTVKLWHFYSQRLSLDGKTPTSPKCVQNEYFDAFNSVRRNNYREFKYKDDENSYLISADFSNKYNEKNIIFTGTNNGKVILWNTHSREILFVTTETGFPLNNLVVFNYSKVFVSKQEKIQIYATKNNEMTYLESIHNLEDILTLFVPNEHTLIAVGSRHVMMYKLPYEDDSSRMKIYESKDHDIKCSAIAQDQYFAIAVREKVLLFAVLNGELVETLEHTKIVISMAMDILHDDDNITSMILMSFDDDNLQLSNVMMQHNTQCRNKHGVVTSFWKNNNLPMLALFSNDNILKIQYEFNAINEISISKKITFISFSVCGNNIIYSTENGEIIEYQYKKQNCFRTLMNLNISVKYLYSFEVEKTIDYSSTEKLTNISDTDNSTIVAITDGDKKIHSLIYGHFNSFSWDLPIFTVFSLDSHHILCIDESCGIFIINILNKKPLKLISYATWSRRLKTVAFSPQSNLVAITFISQENSSYYLEIINIEHTKGLQQSFLNFVPTCCTFSYNGNLLVVGGETGEIIAFNCHNNSKSIVATITGVPLKFLQFSRSKLPILVAVGREISWWNLSNFGMNANNEHVYNDREFDSTFWENKTIHSAIPYLLQTIKLYSKAVHFSVSRNFETFLVVDDESRIYVMKCFKNLQ